MGWAQHRLTYAVLGMVGMLVFAAVAGPRLKRQSRDPHFVLQAAAWLDGRIAIDEWPRLADDPAKVETVLLDDGSQVRGRRLKTRRAFDVAGGGEIPLSRVKRTLKVEHYVSFPPFPAVLMIPQAKTHGRWANDVATTLFFAALMLPLCFAVLRRLAEAGLSERTSREDIWLVLAFAFGSVFFFSAVQGRVWFTAHVVGVVLALSYAWCSIEARRPWLAGLCLGLAVMTRTPMAFMFPLFVFEAWRMTGRDDLRRFLGLGLRFAAPVIAVAAAAMVYNYVRFEEVFEFGHSYLAVRQQSKMETTGMFSHHYLSRNLAVALTLLPKFSSEAPYVQISGHGLAVWFTTPVLLYLLWPRRRGPLHLPLWITTALVALPTLLYQNSGWLQFGYRFSLDYMVFLVMLLAVGGRPLTRLARGLIIFGIAVNLFGAVTFARYDQFYDLRSYGVVLRH